MPKPITAAEARDTLRWCMQRADHAFAWKRKDLDGHYVGGAKHLRGVRVAVRYNRHGRRQVLLGDLTPNARPSRITPELIELFSFHHTKVAGSPLRVSYSEPRQPREDGSYAWVVLNPDQTEERQSLF